MQLAGEGHIHGDVGPHNVLIHPSGRPTTIDFTSLNKEVEDYALMSDNLKAVASQLLLPLSALPKELRDSTDKLTWNNELESQRLIAASDCLDRMLYGSNSNNSDALKNLGITSIETIHDELHVLVLTDRFYIVDHQYGDGNLRQTEEIKAYLEQVGLTDRTVSISNDGDSFCISCAVPLTQDILEVIGEIGEHR